MSTFHLMLVALLAVLVTASVCDGTTQLDAAHARVTASAASAGHQAVRLGAGYDLGRTVFSRYVAYVRQQQRDAAQARADVRTHAPQVAQRPTQVKRWLISVNVHGLSIHLAESDGQDEIIVLPLPRPDRDEPMPL